MDNTEKIKYGIVTEFWNSHNYGGNLQAFALQRFIADNIGSCEQLSYDHEYKSMFSWWIEGIKRSKGKEKINAIKYMIKSIVKYFASPVVSLGLIKRRAAFASFLVNIPHSMGIYKAKQIDKAAGLYERYICGSDVVWYKENNPYCTALGFVPDDKKKISYAASLGTATIPDGWAEKYLDYVKRLDAISVREKSIAEELKELIPEKEINVSVDPTLLFTAEEWDSFLPHNETPENYALQYIISESHEQIQSALKFTAECGLRSLTFPNLKGYIYRWQNKIGDIRNYSANPFEFVELIKNSEVVITDSFHAVIFSVLFHKPFYALKRETQSEFVGRVENFLEDVGLLSQMITPDELASLNTIPQIDFTYADTVIAQNREKSIKYLEENLE